MRDQLESATKTKDAALANLEATEGSTNQLKLQGLSQKEILALKLKDIDAAIQASEVEIERQKSTAKSQIAAAKRNEKIAAGIIQFLTLPISTLLNLIDATTLGLSKFGIMDATNLAGEFSTSIANMIGFDSSETEAEMLEQQKEMEKGLEALKEKRAGFLLDMQDKEQKNSSNSKDNREKEAAELRKLEEEIAVMQLELEEERAVLRLQHQLAYELEALEGKENAEEQKLLIQKKYNKLILEAEDELSEKRKELAEKASKEVADFLEKSLTEYDNTYNQIKDLQATVNQEILDNEGQTLQQIHAQELKQLEEAHIARQKDLDDKIKALQKELEVNKDNEDLKKALAILQQERDKIDIENNKLKNLVIQRQNQETAKQEEDNLQASIDASGQFLDAVTANIDASLSRNTAKMNAEIEATGATGAAKEAIEEKFAAKERRLQARKKAISASQAIINTYVGATKAMSDLPVPANFIAAGATIAAGLANVRQIYAQDVGSGKGGSTPSTNSPTPRTANQAFTLTGAANDEPIRAFVVTDEVTNSQEQLASIKRRSAI